MKTKITVAFLLLFSLRVGADSPTEVGKKIFTSRCGNCHQINKDFTGPALAGVQQRRSMDWIIKFVKSSQTVIKSGDKDAVALYEKFNKIPMPDHQDLKEGEIKNVVEYIKNAASSEAVNSNSKTPKTFNTAHKPPAITNGYWVVFGFLGIMLIGSLFALVKTQNMVHQIVR